MFRALVNHAADELHIYKAISRKVAEDDKSVTDWQLSTFQTDYAPYKNP